MGRGSEQHSVPLPEDIGEEARTHSGPLGPSSYATETIRRKIEQDRLGELLAAMETEHGSVSDERIQAVLDRIDRSYVEQGIQATP